MYTPLTELEIQLLVDLIHESIHGETTRFSPVMLPLAEAILKAGRTISLEDWVKVIQRANLHVGYQNFYTGRDMSLAEAKAEALRLWGALDAWRACKVKYQPPIGG